MSEVPDQAAVAGARLVSPRVLPVAQTTFEVLHSSFDNLVERSVSWMRDRNGAIPEEGLQGAPFEIAGGGASPAHAVRAESEASRLWSARLDDPDQVVPRRTWVTEITVGESDRRLFFGTRLLNVSQGEVVPFSPSRPRIVRDLIEDCEAVADQTRLSNQAAIVGTGPEFDEFDNLLVDRNRTLPVVAISVGEEGDPYLGANQLAARISGTAHVYLLRSSASWELTKRYGKRSSAFNGAVRVYRRGFNPFRDEVGAHPLFLPRPSLDREEGLFVPMGGIINSVFSESLQAFGDSAIPRFDNVRRRFSARQQQEAKSRGDTESLLELYEAEIERLGAEKDAQKSEYDQLLAAASDEAKAAESFVEELRGHIAGLNARIETLSTVLQGREATVIDAPLTSYEDIEDWANRHLAGDVWIAPKALKETKKNGAFRDVEQFGRALLFLRDFYVPMRRDPSEARRSSYEAKLQELRLEDAPSLGNINAVKSDPAYGLTYDGQVFWCERHLKFGGGTDPRDFFRIYFCWNPRNRVLMIGHMPTHLDNTLTN